MSVPQSWNRYSYVENDPINHLDPSGHKKIKWPNGQDPDDDDDRAKKKAKACKNPGQYTGSCKGGPPSAAYAADGEAQHEAKKAGQTAAAGNLAAAQAHVQAAQHFARVAGTSAAWTATMQAYASIIAAVNSMLAAHNVDNRSPNNGTGPYPLRALIDATANGELFFQVPFPTNPECVDPSCGAPGDPYVFYTLTCTREHGCWTVSVWGNLDPNSHLGQWVLGIAGEGGTIAFSSSQILSLDDIRADPDLLRHELGHAQMARDYSQVRWGMEYAAVRDQTTKAYGGNHRAGYLYHPWEINANSRAGLPPFWHALRDESPSWGQGCDNDACKRYLSGESR